MHHVAAHTQVNEEFLQMLRATDGEEDVWLHRTPRDLYEDGRNAVAEPCKAFWGWNSLG